MKFSYNGKINGTHYLLDIMGEKMLDTEGKVNDLIGEPLVSVDDGAINTEEQVTSGELSRCPWCYTVLIIFMSRSY